jgi:methyl-accepting chemotaxis protein
MGIFNFMAGRNKQPAGTGSPMSLMAALQDVAAREQHDAAGVLGTSATLDALDARIMVVDAQRTVVLVNSSALQMLMQAEVEIRKQVPGFAADRLVGSKIDMFYRNAAQQATVFDTLVSTQRDKLQLGQRSFDVIASPVFGAASERLGTVLEWRDTTERMRREKDDQDRQIQDRSASSEGSRLKAALDKVSSRIMVSDAGNVITYINEALVSMLTEAERDIRKEMPDFNARALVGRSSELFNRHLVQPRTAGLASVAGQTYLAIGGRSFTLVTSQMLDGEGRRTGSVIEWKDKTEELRFEAEVQNAIDAAIDGKLATRIAVGTQTGFLANVSGGINQIFASFDSVISEASAVLGGLASGSLTRKITKEYKGSYETLKLDINSTIDKLVEVVTDIRETAEKVKQGASEITNGNTNLSQRTEEQAASLEETSAAMEEITTTVQQNAANAVQANTLARGARETAENGGNVVGKAISAMQAISDSSNKINDIIGVIDEIAFQTNLLALNAAVEAARAGDQGRGFAVVADEVRNLAGRSATAAKEIKELIKDSGNKVQEGASLVNKSGETLDEIVTAVKKVNDIVAEISTASDEQATGLNEINRAVGEMDEMTQQNAALVEEAAAASESLGTQAETLESLLAFFDTGVRRVVQSVAKPVEKAAPARGAAEKKPLERKPAARRMAESKVPPRAAAATARAAVKARPSRNDDGDENNWSEF